MIFSIVAFSLFFSFWAVLYYLRKETLKRGKLEQENLELEGELDAVKRANILRDRLNNDPVFRDSLYKRFTRR